MVPSTAGIIWLSNERLCLPAPKWNYIWGLTGKWIEQVFLSEASQALKIFTFYSFCFRGYLNCRLLFLWEGAFKVWNFCCILKRCLHPSVPWGKMGSPFPPSCMLEGKGKILVSFAFVQLYVLKSRAAALDLLLLCFVALPLVSACMKGWAGTSPRLEVVTDL